MTELYDIIKTLETTPSTNDKLTILNEHKDDLDLKEFFRLCLDSSILFFQSKLPEHKPKTYGNTFNFSVVSSYLKKLSGREFTGNKAKEFLVDELLNFCSPEMCDIINRIVKKDPMCKVSVATVNKVWENLIPTFNFMLCESQSEDSLKKIKYPAYVQDKADGMRTQFFVAVESDMYDISVGEIPQGTIKAITRNGNDVMMSGYLKREFFDMTTENTIYD